MASLHGTHMISRKPAAVSLVANVAFRPLRERDSTPFVEHVYAEYIRTRA